jgi:hypothetical protein
MSTPQEVMLKTLEAIQDILEERGLDTDLDEYDVLKDRYGMACYRAAHVGDVLIVGVMVSDEDAENPMTSNDGMGELLFLNSRDHSGVSDEELEDRIRELDQEHMVYFLVDEMRHSLVHYALRLSPEQHREDGQWDQAIDGLFIPCGDVQEKYAREKYRRGGKAAARLAAYEDSKNCLQEYTDWCNGDAWGIGIVRINLSNGEIIGDLDECWGYIGRDSVERELEDQVRNYAEAEQTRQVPAAA